MQLCIFLIAVLTPSIFPSMLTLSIFSVWLCYKYVKNPKQLPNMASPFCIVTALVDRMDFTAHNLKVGTLGRMDPRLTTSTR